jgi:phosphotransferase system HPr-like phosphotransfer protein
MATTTSITTTYAGEKAAGFISAALLSAPTLDKGGITVKPNVKFKQVMQKLAVGDVIADASCDFTATSSVTLTERYLQPEDFQVNLELCKKDFESDWLSIEQGFSSFDELPKSFAEYLIGHVAAKVAAKTETNIWNGANANAGEFDGIVALAAADADVIDVTHTGATDASNIIARLGDVIDAVPSTIYGNEGLAIYISQADARSYVRAQAALGYKDLYHVGQTAMDFEGVKLFVANGLNSGQMIAAEKDNLFFGTGLQSDMNEVKLIDLADIDGSQNVRVVMRFSAGVNYAIGSEIVLAQAS